MVVNNSLLMLAWIFFFNYFGTINGWGGMDFIGMTGVNMLIFGLVSLVSVGLMDLPRHVDSGSFDNFLTKPTSVLGNVASSNIEVSTIGDIIIGLVLTLIYLFYTQVSLWALGLFGVTLIAGCIVFWCFAMLLPNILAFYMYDSERIGRYAGTMFIDSSLFPVGILTGPLRTFLMTVFPVGLISAVHLDILRGIEPQWALIALGVAVFWLIFSLWLFKRSVRRYESANLIGAR